MWSFDRDTGTSYWMRKHTWVWWKWELLSVRGDLADPRIKTVVIKRWLSYDEAVGWVKMLGTIVEE